MKDQNIKLPPLPHLPLNDPAAAYRVVGDYARAAIAPYAKRIRELESQLEAIGAGGVTQGQRLIEADRKRRGEPVAYLDLGVGGYIDVGTDLTDEELAALPKGRHMLTIIGTYGVDGYKDSAPTPPSAEQARHDDPTPEEEAWQRMESRS